MEFHHFHLHGVGLRIGIDHDSLLAGTMDLLACFHQDEPTTKFDLDIRLHRLANLRDKPLEIPPESKRIFHHRLPGAPVLPDSGEELALHVNRGLILADLGEMGWLAVDGPRRQARGCLVRPEERSPDLISSLLLFMLGALMRGQGFYLLHASALEKNGRGILFVGTGGQGKTTCSLALLRAGYRLLSDDHPFLRQQDGEVLIHAFPEKINLTNETVAFFPELQSVRHLLRQGYRKQFFYPNELYPHAQAESCRPTLLVFPRITDAPQSQMEIIPRARALEKLLPQASLTLAQERVQDQLNVLTALVRQAACYELHYGRNVLDLPRLIEPLFNPPSLHP